jgi:hypothetical protein
MPIIDVAALDPGVGQASSRGRLDTARRPDRSDGRERQIAAQLALL